MDRKNKILIVLIGLAVGFIGSFIWTRSYNARWSETTAASGGMRGPGGAGDPQQMMNTVRATVEKAKSNPGDYEAQIEAARMYAQIGDVGQAIGFLQKAYDADPEQAFAVEVPQYVADFHSKQQNYGEAEKWYRRALQHKPEDPDLLIELGVTFIQREPPIVDKGLQYVEAGLKANPKHPHGLSHLVQAYLVKKDARGAEEALRRLKSVDPSSPEVGALETQVEALKAGKPVTIPKH